MVFAQKKRSNFMLLSFKHKLQANKYDLTYGYEANKVSNKSNEERTKTIPIKTVSH